MTAGLIRHGQPGAWGAALQLLLHVLVPFGAAHELNYDPAWVFLGQAPSAWIFVWVALAPVLVLLIYRWLTDLTGFQALVRPALALAALVILGAQLTPGTDGILVLIGPASRIGSDVSQIYHLASWKLGFVLPAAVWVGILAPLLVGLLPRRTSAST